MASIRKHKSGKWQAQIFKNGVRKSKQFKTQAAAKDWAAYTEANIAKDTESPFRNVKFRDLLERYAREVSPTKKGARWEMIRLEAVQRDKIADKLISSLTQADFADWRDRRLKDVQGSSVAREMQLLSHAFNIAVNEWGWLPVNPMKGVRKPKLNPPRDRRISEAEIERLWHVSNYDPEATPGTVMQRCMVAFMFAIETAMRAGEIIGLTWDRVDLEKRVVKLVDTKNGTSRNVPLSTEAVRLLRLLPEGQTCFGISSSQLDSVFRKMRSQAGIEDLKFHDTRHEAITRLAKKLNVLELARMVGHRNIAMLQVYYNETAEEIALRLD